MPEMNRRGFLKLAGMGTAAAAGAAIPTVEMLFGGHAGTIAIRAVGGVPSEPLPSYASYVLDGYVDPTQKTGTLTRTVLAGHPEGMSEIVLPGLSRTIKITDVRRAGSVMYLRGVIVDRSQLGPGESPDVKIQIDRGGGVVWAWSGANEIKLALQP